jgi:hypothetical protein
MMLALQALAKDRTATAHRVNTEALPDEEVNSLSDRVLDLTAALGELADAYDDQRQDGPPYPSFETILAAYDPQYAASVANKS